MQVDDLIAEHRHLVEVLRSGNPVALQEEADKQEQELQEYLNDKVEAKMTETQKEGKGAVYNTDYADGGKVVDCPYCDEIFETESDKNQHIKKDHPDHKSVDEEANEKKPDNEEVEEKEVCEACHKKPATTTSGGMQLCAACNEEATALFGKSTPLSVIR
jgi:uncharacterized C2H2 Zn-finger protein